MKKLLIGLLALVSISAFADSKVHCFCYGYDDGDQHNYKNKADSDGIYAYRLGSDYDIDTKQSWTTLDTFQLHAEPVLYNSIKEVYLKTRPICFQGYEHDGDTNTDRRQFTIHKLVLPTESDYKKLSCRERLDA